MDRKIIGVVGGTVASPEVLRCAEETGRLIAEHGFLLICGGMAGVMEAAAKGAREAGGTAIGILPHADRHEANPFIDIPIASGLGEGRNLVIVRAADLIIAVDGEYGTLSEIAFALKLHKIVIGLGTWDIPGIIKAATPAEALAIARERLGGE
ncbi:MAG TPA: TIGR00725 family protein [Geobacteraceae bacterium]